MTNALKVPCGKEYSDGDDIVWCDEEDLCPSCQRVKEAREEWEKELIEKIDELLKKKIKDFGISMAGKYRCQGALEFHHELKELLTAHEVKA